MEAETKLNTEVEALQKSCDLKVTEKDKVLIQERGRATNLVARLDHSKVQRRLAKGRAQVAEDRARAADEKVNNAANQAKVVRKEAASAREEVASAAAWVVEEYRDSEAFEADAMEAVAGVYVAGFDDCKARVAEAFPGLDLCCITASGMEEEEEGGEREAAKETVRVRGDAVAIIVAGLAVPDVTEGTKVPTELPTSEVVTTIEAIIAPTVIVEDKTVTMTDPGEVAVAPGAQS